MRFWKRSHDVPLLAPVDGYNLWAHSYNSVSNPIKNLSDRFIETTMPDLKGKDFLDCGCGTGRFCSFARDAGAASITGIDISKAMIELARARCPTAEYFCEDIIRLNLREDSYDVALAALVIAHVQDLESVLLKLTAALRRGGYLVVTDFHPEQTASNAKRTFKEESTGKVFEIQHYLHTIERYRHLLAKANMRLEILEEPTYNNQSVIFGMRAIKK